jgi:Uncharacterised nucleotidyltransferase
MTLSRARSMMTTASPSNNLQTAGLGPEVDLLLCCARTHPSPLITERISSLIPQNFNWDYLITLAKFNKVIPLLYRNLNYLCPELVPEKTLKQLKTLIYTNTCRNLFLTQELIYILKLFEKNGIPTIAFKGLTLAISAYQDVSFRQISDLDLLLPKEAIDSAQELLIAEGFQLIGNYEWEFHYCRIDGNVHVDLHQEIAPRVYALPFDFQQLWSRIQPIPLGGTNIPHLQTEDLLLLLTIVWCRDCTYLNSHLSLHLLSDVDALLSKHTSLDWTWILEQARKQGCDRILRLMLFSAQEVLGTDLPKIVLDEIKSRPLPPYLIQSVWSRLLRNPNNLDPAPDKSGFWEAIWAYDHRFYLQSRERLRDRFIYCLNWILMSISVALTPNKGDWELMTFPPNLSFLYYPLHITRLIFKHIIKPLYQPLSSEKTVK